MPAAVEETSVNTNANSTANSAAENQEEEDKSEDRDQKMWKVLKAYILKDRARKKQEREAEVQEERLRKEREAREQQDVMTLGETREQISQLEAKLQQLKDEKHQLFLQLKKVLNEDDNRRRQLQKDANEQHMVQIQSLQQMVPQMPQTLYIQQPPGRIQTIAQQVVPPMQPAIYKTAVKRPRSPKDDGRRNELVRAVLWNKVPQYTNQPSAFYPVAPQEISMFYPGLSREAGRPMYDQQRPQSFQMDHKIAEHYPTLRTASSQQSHVIHPGGSITAGYPIRTQQQYQQAAPASLYTAQSRQMYQNYQRD
ncbi:hypothetical protein D910_05494 [Dendroctonus ponderosae]|uniref:G protein pathway suppressor 2 n=1 Tax=Dendroctonus ponderosae TaxID=77166 RepID=U4TSF8_DENPD|nr:hypothetical protein D910_00876 [Dendroctonus ponderosae]ERL88105.1 hypothetical protein D910_05494 [Dendroctonus ponderosae]